MFRRKVTRALTGEVIARRNGSGGTDVLGAIVRAAPADADPGQLAEVFLSCLFAVTGAAGFVVAWSVYMLVTHPQELGVPPSRIVREALRLWPVAWLFGRRPTAPLELGGIAVTPRHEVVVCSYLAQRHPAYWAEPDEFSPQRWAGTDDNTGYLPFGWGPHSCTGAAIVLQFAELVIGALTSGYRLRITQHQARAQLAAMLAPPPFTMHLTPLAS
jgi:cytochrome P450